MTDETRAKVENRVLQIAKLADEICERVYSCDDCPLSICGKCVMENACNVAVDIQERNRKQAEDIEKVVWEKPKEPTYEELPIDLDDDNHCDECYKPVFNECLTDKYNEDCPYDLGECCEDNLATNVGRICFEHNVSTNVAMALIEIIKKERDRNEYLHLYRKHFPAE